MKTLLKSCLNRIPLALSSTLYSSAKGVPVRSEHPHYSKILTAAEKVRSRLQTTNINLLPVSNYSKEYLRDIQVNATGCLTKFIGVLSYSLPDDYSNQTQFLDYGAGTGLISVLAAELGVQVTFNDLSEISCEDFGPIASALVPGHRIPVVFGDIGAVVEDARKRQILYDAVGSYDVLEHIYRPENFYREIQAILKPDAIVFMATSANSFNASTVNQLAEVQLLWEGGPTSRQMLDGTPTYFGARREHCSRFAKQKNLSLTPEQLDSVASRTRGMITPEIEQRLEAFVKDPDVTSVDPYFPSNACHPDSGNWTEHLLNYPLFIQSLNQDWKSTLFPENEKRRAQSHVLGILSRPRGRTSV